MPRDLKNAPDHPAIVLSHHANVTVMVAHTAAVALRKYEREANVTFAALANDLLVELKREYDRYVLGKSNALGAAIDALLGLED